ncbi:hypothetical protein Htur_4978 (plasmid) [Haloterrigena turkmenica DSM 5511]|uniref:Lipoprotein n=1 Tax=Haloterrigena turkmenica (strain ATCC 51198 / DSM 5511 / JCM 9101 / NCIMB 13204 / VKM B-1734 / 4k) TaxID=543526 RepID=D2S2W3_HALTV|nr:hypothetical protein [Haloterrigena turkmenica]ADB63710.1 hypothetical protein Htur_4978 [Haloterrigena turkmenica DSM 5511]
MNRRWVLASTGFAFSTAIAGCADLNDEPAINDDSDEQDADHGTDDEIAGDDDRGEEPETDDPDQEHDDEDPYEDDEANNDSDEAADEEQAEDEADDEEEQADKEANGERDEDIDGEVSLPDTAQDHLTVRDHWFGWNEDDGGCTVHVKLEKTTDAKYHLEFGTKATVYSDDGEQLERILDGGEDGSPFEEGEMRVYSIGQDRGTSCEGAAAYEARVAYFEAYVPLDELEPDFDLDPELEDKLEITDHSINMHGDEYAPLYAHNAEYSDRYATVKNVTGDYRLSVRGPDGEFHDKTVDLDPGETADFKYTGRKYYADIGNLTYGFSIAAEDVTELDGEAEGGNETDSEE